MFPVFEQNKKTLLSKRHRIDKAILLVGSTLAALVPGTSGGEPSESGSSSEIRIQPNKPAHDEPAVNELTQPVNLGTQLEVDDTSCLRAIGSNQLWSDAYENVKKDNPKLVDAYEKLLSREFKLEETESTRNEMHSKGNSIKQDREERAKQMAQLAKESLRRTEREGKLYEKVDDGMRIFSNIKSLIEKALKTSPEAGVAWSGILFIFEILHNPVDESLAQRKGLKHVLSRMEWYWCLSVLLLDGSNDEYHKESLLHVRKELTNHIGDLYEKLLSFQMTSICMYYRNRGVGFLRNLASLENWLGKLQDVEAAEERVRRDCAVYTSSERKMQVDQSLKRLDSILRSVQDTEGVLHTVYAALESYSENENKYRESQEDKKCLADLFKTDPYYDKIRIERSNGVDSQNADFRKWMDEDDSNLLWIKGGPGKGKTMLLISIINELSNSPSPLLYFFCQGTHADVNNASGVARGLVYMLAKQRATLIRHVREKYDSASGKLFESQNSFYALSEILENMLGDESMQLRRIFIVIDALDECLSGREDLLQFISKISLRFKYVKILVSSRNGKDIDIGLKIDGHGQKLSLETRRNAESVIQAVNNYIEWKVLGISFLDDCALREKVIAVIQKKAGGTFLWASLVIQELEQEGCALIAMEIIGDMPSGLEQVYGRIFEKIRGRRIAWNHCRRILSTVVLAYKPLHLAELGALCMRDTHYSDGDIRNLIELCGSFLTVQESIVNLVHLSAKDYLLKFAQSEILPGGIASAHVDMSFRALKAMSAILRRNIYNLKAFDMPIEQIVARKPNPDHLVAVSYSCVYWADHYCCAFDDIRRNDQICSVSNHVADVLVQVHSFFTEDLLHWIEAMSLLQSIHVCVRLLRNLEMLLEKENVLRDLVDDALKFLLQFAHLLAEFPLQTYVSALVFSARTSLVRSNFGNDLPCWIRPLPVPAKEWDPWLLRIPFAGTVPEELIDMENTMSCTSDGRFLATRFSNCEIRIWDCETGFPVKRLIHDEYTSLPVCISSNGKYVLTCSGSKAITSHEEASSLPLSLHLPTLPDFYFHRKPAFDIDVMGRINIWKIEDCLRLNVLFEERCTSVALSNNNRLFLTVSEDHTIKIWDLYTGVVLRTLGDSHSKSKESGSLQPHFATFTEDGKWILSRTLGSDKIKIWNVHTGRLERTLDFGSLFRASSQPLAAKHIVTSLTSMKASHNSLYVAGGAFTGVITLVEFRSGTVVSTFLGHSEAVSSLSFFKDDTHLVSGSHDGFIKVWDLSSGLIKKTITVGTAVRWIAVCNNRNRKIIFSCDSEGTMKTWNADDGIRDGAASQICRPRSTVGVPGKMLTATCEPPVDEENGISKAYLCSVTFSYDRRKIILLTRLKSEHRFFDTANPTYTVSILDASTATVIFAFRIEYRPREERCLWLSPEVPKLALHSETENVIVAWERSQEIFVFSATTGMEISSFTCGLGHIINFELSENGKYIACRWWNLLEIGSRLTEVSILVADTETGLIKRTVKLSLNESMIPFAMFFSRDDQYLAISASVSEDNPFLNFLNGRPPRSTAAQRPLELYILNLSGLETNSDVNLQSYGKVNSKGDFVPSHITLPSVSEFEMREQKDDALNFGKIDRGKQYLSRYDSFKGIVGGTPLHGYHLAKRGEVYWLAWGRSPILQLPDDFRGDQFDFYTVALELTSASTVTAVLGSSTGRILIMGLPASGPPPAA